MKLSVVWMWSLSLSLVFLCGCTDEKARYRSISCGSNLTKVLSAFQDYVVTHGYPEPESTSLFEEMVSKGFIKPQFLTCPSHPNANSCDYIYNPGVKMEWDEKAARPIFWERFGNHRERGVVNVIFNDGKVREMEMTANEFQDLMYRELVLLSSRNRDLTSGKGQEREKQ